MNVADARDPPPSPHADLNMIRAASFVALALACLSGVPVKGQFNALTADIAAISSHVSLVSSAISVFPTAGGSRASATFIHAQATSIASALKTAVTAAAAAKDLGDTNGTTVIDSLAEFEDQAVMALEELVIKKAAFESLGISSTLLADLESLQTESKAFENAWVPDIPSDILMLATGLTSAYDRALETAIAGYS